MTFTDRIGWLLVALVGLAAGPAWAWGNHSLAAYRAFEKMPEVALAPAVVAEPLEAFLRAEERTIVALLDSQEAWAAANLEHYPPRPASLTFAADAVRSDEARRLAFLGALRVAPNSRLALYYQPDPQSAPADGVVLPHSAVNTLPESTPSSYRYLAVRAGESIAALQVLASACDEPDYGLDINLWEDSPSDWGRSYGFGPLPFGNPALPYATQAPFHMGFFFERRVLYMAAPFIKRTFPTLRHHQFATLSALAFRTGHPYWGWRFAGLSLHYLQDLTQPYHATVAPGEATWKLLATNAIAMAGMPGMKNDLVVLLSNRHLALEKYQTEVLQLDAQNRQETALTRALRNTDKDRAYPPWSDAYLREVVAAQSVAQSARLSQALLAALPAAYVSDPGFDFGVKEAGINLVREMAQRDAADRGRLDAALLELMGNFGAHSRNALRAILKAGSAQ